MAYDSNKTIWPVGSIVIHAGDSKRDGKMLMRVIGYTSDGMAKTEYINLRQSRRRVYKNDIKWLLDPVQFGVKTQSAPEVQ